MIHLKRFALGLAVLSFCFGVPAVLMWLFGPVAAIAFVLLPVAACLAYTVGGALIDAWEGWPRR